MSIWIPSSLLKASEQKQLQHLPPSLQNFRKKAKEELELKGFPRPQEEDWKYSSLQFLDTWPFQNQQEAKPSLQWKGLEHFPLLQEELPTLVFINGRYEESLSVLHSFPEEITLCSLSEALKQKTSLVEESLGQAFGPETSARLLAFNNAFFQDGLFLHVPPHLCLTTPVQILFYNFSAQESDIFYPRNLVIIGEGSHINLLECHVGDPSSYFSNSVSEFLVGAGSHLHHHRIQQEGSQACHVGHIAYRLERESEVKSFSIALGSKFNRNELYATLKGPAAHLELNGLFIAQQEQLLDHQTFVNHAVPYCSSDEYYKGILDGKSQGVFQGKILVQPKALKTNASQLNKNLLLSREAQMSTKPLLEILNNDVKCSHGATLGRLDEEHIFYLRSRGIEEKRAKDLLTYAFAAELIEKNK